MLGTHVAMRILFALPGLHRYDRGAETAFICIATVLAQAGHSVTLIGSGQPQVGRPYQFLHAGSIGRENFEHFPALPLLRNECAYEELTFAPALLRSFRTANYDVTITCGYPYTNWVLRRPAFGRNKPRHVFVTENGDWPAFANSAEYRFFGCDGLVCTNPDFFERNKNRWRSSLIPNGVDCEFFRVGPTQGAKFGLPHDRQIVLMVSALVPNKRVQAAIAAVSRIPNAHLVVAGDGPLRQEIDDLAERLLPGRFTRLLVKPDQMPALYQSANVFLHLCKDESFGNVLLEAMACGLPVVAHDVERVKWIVGDTAILCNTDDPDLTAQHIAIASNIFLNNRDERLAQAAKFSWKRVGKMYERFLEEIVSSPSSQQDCNE